MSHDPASRLHRVLGVGGASAVGIGAMLGTGVFAAWTPALDLAGSLLLVALGLAAMVAALNATSTAALARALPEAGGVYAYGKAFVGRGFGVAAGYSFVIGKSASAGAAALTIGAYVWPAQQRLIGVLAVVIALALGLRGITKSVRVGGVLVIVVIAILGALAIAWWTSDAEMVSNIVAPPTGAMAVLGAAGLLFVAFAGYARVTVLGEEVRNPARTIPRAMLASFAVVMTVYVVIGLTVVNAVQRGVNLSTAPLENIAAAASIGALPGFVRAGAVLAAGAALLSLIAGIGRTVFAMAAGGDAPAWLAAVGSRRVPQRAEMLAAVCAVAVVAIGGIGAALALSAATILTYYGIAHLSVLARWRRGETPGGLLPVIAALGLVGCLAVVVGIVSVALASVSGAGG